MVFIAAVVTDIRFYEMVVILSRGRWVNSSPPGQNDHHFADDIFSCILANEIFCILIKISLNFVPNSAIDNNAALVKIMAWYQLGDKPLSESMLTRLTDAYMWH